MYNYSLALALFDYIPIALSALGWFWLWHWSCLKASPSTNLIALGGTLVVLGGLSKATWKLVIALSGQSIDLLNNNLFLLMTPGFALLLVGIWRTTASLSTPTSAPAPVLQDKFLITCLLLTLACPIAVTLLSEHPRGWFLALVALTTVFNTAMIIRISVYAWNKQQRLAACLFLANLITTFVLSGLARGGDQSEATQWMEEMINTGAQGILALAAFLLARSEKAETKT